MKHGVWERESARASKNLLFETWVLKEYKYKKKKILCF